MHLELRIYCYFQWRPRQNYQASDTPLAKFPQRDEPRLNSLLWSRQNQRWAKQIVSRARLSPRIHYTEWTNCMMILSHPYHHCLCPCRINIHARQRASNPLSPLHRCLSFGWHLETLSIINSWRAKHWSLNSRSKSQTKPLVLWQIWRQICETSIPPSHIRVLTSLRLRQVQLSTQGHMFYVKPLFHSEPRPPVTKGWRWESKADFVSAFGKVKPCNLIAWFHRV